MSGNGRVLLEAAQNQDHLVGKKATVLQLAALHSLCGHLVDHRLLAEDWAGIQCKPPFTAFLTIPPYLISHSGVTGHHRCPYPARLSVGDTGWSHPSLYQLLQAVKCEQHSYKHNHYYNYCCNHYYNNSYNRLDKSWNRRSDWMLSCVLYLEQTNLNLYSMKKINCDKRIFIAEILCPLAPFLHLPPFYISPSQSSSLQALTRTLNKALPTLLKILLCASILFFAFSLCSLVVFAPYSERVSLPI